MADTEQSPAAATTGTVTRLPSAEPATPVAAAPPAPAQDPAPAKRRRRLRWPLMLALPLLLAVGGGYVWATSGRFEDTDNAYVKHDIVSVGADVAGRIAAVPVGENGRVKAGDELFRIDDAQYRIAVEAREAALAAAKLQVAQMRAAYGNAVAARKAAEDTLAYQQTVLDRQQRLFDAGTSSKAAFDEARHDLDADRQALVQAGQAVDSALAALGGDPDVATEKHPLVMQAAAALDQARLDLDHTVVRAPADGIVAGVDGLKVGRYVGPGAAVLSLVATGDTWVEANFKETQLTHMKVGDPVTLSFDAYPDLEVKGRVDSLGAGTGSIFSLLPAENATGNWVKVVQRVPVRIALDDGAGTGTGGRVFASGLSTEVVVDTGWQRPLPGPVHAALSAFGLSTAEASEVAAQ